MGKLLIIVGILCILAGVFVTYGPKIPGLGKLPGDIVFERGSFRVYFPLMTSVLISLLLSIILYLFNRWRQ